MSLMANAAASPGDLVVEGKPVELEGRFLKAIEAAHGAFRQKAPDADINNYNVKIRPQGHQVQITFIPRQDANAAVLGGKTPYGRELSVLISIDDYSIEKVQFAR